MSPGSVNAGDVVSISFLVTNDGNAPVNYSVDLWVGGVLEGTASGALEAKASRTHEFGVFRTEPGPYFVAVGSLVGTFEVKGAQVGVTGLSIFPRNITANDPVEVTAQVVNNGGSPGNYALSLNIDGAAAGTAEGVLPAGQEKSLYFVVSSASLGTHWLTLNGLVDSFNVLPPVVDARIPSSASINISATTATDDQGNAVQVTGGALSIVESADGLFVDLPVALPQGGKLAKFEDSSTGIKVSQNRVEIPVRDATGKVIMKLVGEIEGVVGANGVGRAKIKALRMETEEGRVDLSSDDPAVGQVSASIGSTLNRIPTNSRLLMNVKKELPPDARAGFELIARGSGKTVVDVGAAVEVKRENLRNGQDVGEVRLQIKVGAAWVQAHGGVEAIQITRQTDEGTREFLKTNYLGIDSEGRHIFEGVSPNGFSVFGVGALGPIPTAITVTGLQLEPAVVQPGEPVKVTATVRNSGANQGTYKVVLSINGELTNAKAITLKSGQEGPVAFFVIKQAEGAYNTAVDGLRGSFIVAKTLARNQVSFSGLKVTPDRVNPNEPVTATVTVSNSGSSAGKTDVEFRVNGVLAQVVPVSVPAQGSAQASLTLKKSATGAYRVSVGDLTASFTVAKVLRAARFTIADLAIAPASVNPGQKVTIGFKLTNEGDLPGAYVAELRINNAVEAAKTVNLEGLSSTQVLFEVARSEPGTYQVAVGSLGGSFTVVRAPGPSFVLTNLKATPVNVKVGQKVTVTVLARNVGDTAGTTIVTCTANGKLVEAKDITLAAGESKEVQFVYTPDEAGAYIMAVDGLSTQVDVTGAGVNILLIVLPILLVLAAGVVAFILLRRKPAAAK